MDKMRYTLLLLLFISCGSGDSFTYGFKGPEEIPTTYDISSSLIEKTYEFKGLYYAPLPDTIKTQICAIRGHHLAGRKRVVDNNCPKYIIDALTYSLLVSGGCNQISRTCERCGTEVIEQLPQRRDTIWKYRAPAGGGAAGGGAAG